MAHSSDLLPGNMDPVNGEQAASVKQHNVTRMAQQFVKLGLSEPEKEALRAEVVVAEMMRRHDEATKWRPITDDLPCNHEYIVKTNGIPTYAIAIKRARRRWPWGKKHIRWYKQSGILLKPTPLFYRPIGSLM